MMMMMMMMMMMIMMMMMMMIMMVVMIVFFGGAQHKLQKELILTRQNQAKLTDKWRRLMRESKSAELSGQLQVRASLKKTAS